MLGKFLVMMLLFNLLIVGWINEFSIFLVDETIEFVDFVQLFISCNNSFGLSNLSEATGVGIHTIFNSVAIDLLLFLVMMMNLSLFRSFKLDVDWNRSTINISHGTIVIVPKPIDRVESFHTIFGLLLSVHVFVKIVNTFGFSLNFISVHLFCLKPNILLFLARLKHLINIFLDSVKSWVHSLDGLGFPR